MRPVVSLALVMCGSLAFGQEVRSAGADISLDGDWQTGLDRHYTDTTPVPGLAEDPAKTSAGTLWYKRTVKLPDGDWKQAILTLNGARFAPTVYVDGVKVSTSGGGMAPTVHVLRSAAVAPGKTIVLEIALQSQKDLDPKDASAVPGADLWRTNVSSSLWDSVLLHLAGGSRFTHVIPFTSFKNDSVSIHWQAEGSALPGETVKATIEDEAGKVLVSSQALPVSKLRSSIDLPLRHAIEPWSPEQPHVYKLRLVLVAAGKTEDEHVVSWGLKDFQAREKQFFLNGEPTVMRGGTVVFQRFLRNPEVRTLAFDPEWFQTNIMLRLKSYGANTLRFHLGLPPERLLDLCDRDGLMVQMEWPFFHGVKASIPSMEEQWHEWLDVAMRHPSVMIVHGWNETDGNELTNAWTAMNATLADYPPLVVAHRDTLHVHKYWWSLFENLGLYYDSANQFDRTIMVDEFGGNYLDLKGDPGLYPTVKETFLRFLGREQTRDERLEFHAESNARVGEYWRRIGASGILPFDALGGPQDGSSWFLDSFANPKPMPVWDALAATFSPLSVSLDVWDRNYTPGQNVTLPVYLFNDTGTAITLGASVQVLSIGENPRVLSTHNFKAQVPAHQRVHIPVTVTLPASVGDWKFAATLLNPVPGVTHPVISSWNFRTLAPVVPQTIAHVAIGVPDEERELIAFLKQNNLKVTSVDDPHAAVLLTSARTWAQLTPKLRSAVAAAVDRGQSVVMLDVGPHNLGQGYRKGDLGPLDGVPVIKPGEAHTETQELFKGIKATFTEVAEPESHIQPAPNDNSLWANLPPSATWLWNGLRGGLVAPAADMEVNGLSADAFIAQWSAHGADAKALAAGSYFAYELAGYYAFSTKPDDKATIDALRQRVRFLAEDAPALQAVVNPTSTVAQTDLHRGLHDASSGQAQQLLALSTCGKNLTRTDIAELTFGTGKGNVILSQALTAGRLARGAAEPGFYGIRYDPAAEQFVLNMIARSLR